MELRYFWVADQVKQGTMMPVYCNTNDMLADVLTKPLQGSQFGLLRDLLLNRGTNKKNGKNMRVLRVHYLKPVQNSLERQL